MNTVDQDRVKAFDGINNFRDFGGWRTGSGGRIATGVLFRSAHLARASDSDLARMLALGITDVIDLRQAAEQAEQPSAWIGRLALAVIEEPDDAGSSEAFDARLAPHLAAFAKSDFSAGAMRDLLAGHYRTMPYERRNIALFRRYFQRLATGHGGMLIHCAAGKDRTGILVRLTHHVLDVHPDDALEDYLLSNTAGNLAARLPRLKRHMEQVHGRSIDSEAIRTLLSVEPAYIAQCWMALRSKSGSVDNYLADVLGVEKFVKQQIRKRLLS
jgi:protein tyrosine/serine phosphatase